MIKILSLVCALVFLYAVFSTYVKSEGGGCIELGKTDIAKGTRKYQAALTIGSTCK